MSSNIEQLLARLDTYKMMAPDPAFGELAQLLEDTIRILKPEVQIGFKHDKKEA